MKCITIVGSVCDRSLALEMYQKYEKYIPKEFKKTYPFSNNASLMIPFEPDSIHIKEAIKDLEDNNAHYLLISRVKYSKSELEKTEYFNWLLPTPLELEGKRAVHYGTQYNQECSVCSMVRDPIDHVLIDKKFLRKTRVGLVFPDIIVKGEIKELFEQEGITGVSFSKKVCDYKGRDIDEFYVMDIHNILPPLSDKTWLEKSVYKCGHEYFYLRSDMHYEKEKLLNAVDINYTCENLYNVNNQGLVVSAKVRDLLRKHQLRIGRFDPVTLI